MVRFKGRMEEGENGTRRHRAAPFLNGAAGIRGRGGGGRGLVLVVRGATRGRRGLGGGLVPTDRGPAATRAGDTVLSK
jgi:hypothetical protein